MPHAKLPDLQGNRVEAMPAANPCVRTRTVHTKSKSGPEAIGRSNAYPTPSNLRRVPP